MGGGDVGGVKGGEGEEVLMPVWGFFGVGWRSIKFSIIWQLFVDDRTWSECAFKST